MAKKVAISVAGLLKIKPYRAVSGFPEETSLLNSFTLLLLLIHTFRVLSLQLKKLR